MVLSNKKLKHRLRAETARHQGSVPVFSDKPKSINKREKKRRRRQQLQTSSPQPPQSPVSDIPAIAQVELDIYNRCIETLLHKQGLDPSSEQAQKEEEVLASLHSPNEHGPDTEVEDSEQHVLNIDNFTLPMSISKSRKRKKVKKIEKQEEQAKDCSQGQRTLVSDQHNVYNENDSSFSMSHPKPVKQVKDLELNAITEKQIEQAADHSAEDQDSIESRTVYVGGIPYYSSQEDIKAFFSDCGTISEVNLKTFNDTGKFRGIALLTFKTVGGARRALALDGASMGDRFLKVQPSAAKPKESVKKEVHHTPPAKTEGYLRAYVGNLSWSVTEEDIRFFFRGCKIDKVKFSEDRVTGEFRGFGHVDFADDESLERALQLDQEILLERPIKVAYAVPNRTEKRIGTPVRERKEVTCHTCGEKGHVSSHCPYMGRGQ